MIIRDLNRVVSLSTNAGKEQEAMNWLRGDSAEAVEMTGCGKHGRKR